MIQAIVRKGLGLEMSLSQIQQILRILKKGDGQQDRCSPILAMWKRRAKTAVAKCAPWWSIRTLQANL